MITREIAALIDGRRLFGLVVGEGKTTVVLDAGLGGTSDDWAPIQLGVAQFATAFSYDRAGLGRSEKAAIPRTCPEIVADLRHLLSAVALRPPYVLVAHSWSGINARWYAQQHPGEIAGMVLVDPAHEDKYDRFAQVLPQEQAERMWAVVRDPTKNDEHIDRITSIAQVRDSRSSFKFPLIILTRAAGADELGRIETSLQTDFLKLSPKSWQSHSQYDDHHIHVSEPELVIASIRQIVAMVEAHTP
jgi:pimeloyl-ACP methyl ester carboxylesterase